MKPLCNLLTDEELAYFESGYESEDDNIFIFIFLGLLELFSYGFGFGAGFFVVFCLISYL